MGRFGTLVCQCQARPKGRHRWEWRAIGTQAPSHWRSRSPAERAPGLRRSLGSGPDPESAAGGSQAGATRINDSPILRTSTDIRPERSRGRERIWTSADGRTGIYGFVRGTSVHRGFATPGPAPESGVFPQFTGNPCTQALHSSSRRGWRDRSVLSRRPRQPCRAAVAAPLRDPYDLEYSHLVHWVLAISPHPGSIEWDPCPA